MFDRIPSLISRELSRLSSKRLADYCIATVEFIWRWNWRWAAVGFEWRMALGSLEAYTAKP
jgi:hypothetical protein